MSITQSAARLAELQSAQMLAWMQALDQLGLPLLLFDQAGGELYRAGALGAMVPRACELARLAAVARQAAMQLSRPDAAVSGAASGGISPCMRSRSSRYVLRSAWIQPPSHRDIAPCVLVIVERRGLPLPAGHDLKARFGLTAREADVALLLAQRRQNIEIAETLCVSVHTARHHTERVLEKLDLNRRTQVEQVLADNR